ncbi:MAG: hypothetical protein C5B54_00895 [Acidobacteria bacterium]|nr:MAG: hypothetical protein C5B54_00895 [Acidobacteriota bacterium]
MIDRTLVFTITGALIWMLIVLRMVYRRRLKEQFLLLWLIITVVLLAMASSRGLLVSLATLVGIHYPPSVLILFAIGSLLLILLHFSVVMSRLMDENKSLAQEIAMMRWQLRTLEKTMPEDSMHELKMVK